MKQKKSTTYVMNAYTNPNAVPLQKLNIYFVLCIQWHMSVLVQSMFVYKKDIESQVRAMHVQFVVIAYTFLNIIPFNTFAFMHFYVCLRLLFFITPLSVFT